MSLEQDKEPMVVQVDTEGRYALVLPGNDRPQAVAAEELEARVRAIVNQNPKQAIFVAGDGSANYQKVMDAMVLRSEEHTSELQSLMRLSYAVFCLTKKKKNYEHCHIRQ